MKISPSIARGVVLLFLLLMVGIFPALLVVLIAYAGGVIGYLVSEFFHHKYKKKKRGND